MVVEQLTKMGGSKGSGRGTGGLSDKILLSNWPNFRVRCHLKTILSDNPVNKYATIAILELN